jgi:RNA polymerase sigma-70 factor (ECF subfamily)
VSTESKLDETALIEKAIKGDESSFEALILSCQKKAWNIAIQYMRNQSDAMDVLQECFIKIFRNLKNFKGDSRFDTWVYRIMVNTCKDFLRKNEKTHRNEIYFISNDDEEYVREIPSGEPSPEERLSRQETIEELLECMEQLPFDHKEVIVLRDIQNLSYDEISEILSTSLGTVKSRINRARSNLKKLWLEQKKLDNV